MNKILCLIALLSVSTSLCASKMYIDEKELSFHDASFRIHVGHNNWIETDTIHRDNKGIYTFENRIVRDAVQRAYQRTWKCPYCFHWWPIGKPCDNDECPSKYK